MLYLILAAILLLVIIGGVAVGITASEPGAYAVAGIAFLFLAGITAFASFTTVDARAVGIQTAFGRYVDTIGPGPHWLAPWSSVEEFSTIIQTTDLNDLNGGSDSVIVSFSAPKIVDENGKEQQSNTAGGGAGNINAVVRWKISDDQSNEGARRLWENFKTFERTSEDLVLSESQNKIIDVAQDYPAGEAVVNTDKIANEVFDNLSSYLKPYGIVVDSVAIKKIVPDSATQASLQTIVDNINKTAAAAEEQKRAAIDNQTTKERREEGALDSDALVRYCLDVVNHWDVAKNGPLPATFNCGLGADDNVLVGVK